MCLVPQHHHSSQRASSLLNLFISHGAGAGVSLKGQCIILSSRYCGHGDVREASRVVAAVAVSGVCTPRCRHGTM